MVHAPQRPIAGLRMGLRRRQSAGARLGGLARLPNRPQAARRRRAICDFLERVFHKLMLNFTWWVNRKDAAGPQHLPGRLPRPRQHRRVRPQRSRCPPAATSTRPTAPVWMAMYSPQPACASRSSWPAQPGLRGHRHQVLRALPLHRRRDDQHRRRRASACGTRRTSSSTTC